MRKTHTIMLDRPRRIRVDHAAIAQLSAMWGGMALDELTAPGRKIATLVDFLWVCLLDRGGVESPEDLADMIPGTNSQLWEIARRALVDYRSRRLSRAVKTHPLLRLGM